MLECRALTRGTLRDALAAYLRWSTIRLFGTRIGHFTYCSLVVDQRRIRDRRHVLIWDIPLN